jgi:hypothetical protein
MGDHGSTIATLGLDQAWRDGFGSLPDQVTARNEILGDEPLGPYVLDHLDIQVDRGTGVYLINSRRDTDDLMTIGTINLPVEDARGISRSVVGEG